jgi:hypothetical protein
VRNLEERVAWFEGQLRRTPSWNGQQAISLSSPTNQASESPASTVAPHQSIAQPDNATALESEVTNLSLDATADRYLGSASGVSFAKLTQAVLRRLKPDHRPFDFEVDGSIAASGRRALENPEVTLTSQPGAHSPEYPSCLPTKSRAYELVDFYFSHNHLLYPFLRKSWFMSKLATIYSQQDHDLYSSPSWLYTMWMVFAIGATCWTSIVDGAPETEAVYCYNQAMLYFDDTLSPEGITALDSLLLQISYSFFNRVGGNTWYLVGAAVRLAIGMGLHSPSASAKQLPMDAQEHRRRIFWSLYMADRVVSLSLGRPFAIRDDDIDLDPFSAVDDDRILTDQILPQPPLKSSDLIVPLHILSLRQIASQIFDQVYSNKNKHLEDSEQAEIFSRLHAQLLEWRRTIPFPLPRCQSLQIPHTSTSWYDYNYYMQLIMLYRPSPLCPVLTLEKVELIADASAMAIRHVEVMHDDHRYSYNWITLFNLFSMAITLIYSIMAQPDPLPIYLKRTDALSSLERASKVLGNFAQKYPTVARCRAIVQDVSERLRSLMTSAQGTHPSVDTSVADQARWMTGPQLASGIDSTSVQAGDLDPISFPAIATGNQLFDKLQNRVSSTEHSQPSSTSPGYENPLPSVFASRLPQDFQLAATMAPYGDAAQQFMAAGFGLGEPGELEMDQMFMDFLDGTLHT